MAHSCDLSQFGGSRPVSANVKRARRVLEGGPISEQRYLEMQADVYRLRREANTREEEHKHLLAKLSRAEDAAKRQMRDTIQHALEPGKLKTDMIAAVSHHFYADQRMLELEEKLREKQREIVKVAEHNKLYKADICILRTRLETVLRNSRRAKLIVIPRELTPTHQDKAGEELRKEVQRLQTDNLNLQFKISSLSHPPSLRSEIHSQSCRSMQDVSCQAQEPEMMECELKQSLKSVQSSAKYVTSQMLETWQQLEGLQKRYDRSIEELQILKVNHENLLTKLRDARRELNEERMKSMQLEMNEMRLQKELNAAQQTEILLQQARQHNLQLERKNAELTASALKSHGKSKICRLEDKFMTQASVTQEGPIIHIARNIPEIVNLENDNAIEENIPETLCRHCT